MMLHSQILELDMSPIIILLMIAGVLSLVGALAVTHVDKEKDWPPALFFLAAAFCAGAIILAPFSIGIIWGICFLILIFLVVIYITCVEQYKKIQKKKKKEREIREMREMNERHIRQMEATHRNYEIRRKTPPDSIWHGIE